MTGNMKMMKVVQSVQRNLNSQFAGVIGGHMMKKGLELKKMVSEKLGKDNQEAIINVAGSYTNAAGLALFGEFCKYGVFDRHRDEAARLADVRRAKEIACFRSDIEKGQKNIEGEIVKLAGNIDNDIRGLKEHADYLTAVGVGLGLGATLTLIVGAAIGVAISLCRPAR